MPFFFPQRSNNGSKQLLNQESECIFYENKKLKLTMSTQTQTHWIQIKIPNIITEGQRESFFFFRILPWDLTKCVKASTNFYFVVSMIKTSRKKFKGICVFRYIYLQCFLANRLALLVQKIWYVFYCKNVWSQLTLINKKAKQIC